MKKLINENGPELTEKEIREFDKLYEYDDDDYDNDPASGLFDWILYVMGVSAVLFLFYAVYKYLGSLIIN